MKVLIMGGDGHCGWATALHLSNHGFQVAIMDSLVRRDWNLQLGIKWTGEGTQLTPMEAKLSRGAA